MNLLWSAFGSLSSIIMSIARVIFPDCERWSSLFLNRISDRA